MAVLVDAEVAGDHRLVVDDAADREALGHEPPGKVALDPRLARLGRDALDAHQRRGQHPPRRRGQPVGGEEREHVARERHRRDALGKQRVGDELGVQLPLQEAAPDRARIVAGARRRMRRAMAVEERGQVRAVAVAVALGGVLRLHDREVQRAAGRGQLGERPGVQLVHEAEAAGIVVERELGHARGSPRLRERRNPATPRAECQRQVCVRAPREPAGATRGGAVVQAGTVRPIRRGKERGTT